MRPDPLNSNAHRKTAWTPKAACMAMAMLAYALAPAVGLAAERFWDLPPIATWTEDPRHGATLAWERSVPAAARAIVFREGEPLVLEERQPLRRHVFTFRGLEPGTHYRYAVESDDGFRAEGRFWTAPQDRTDAFSFVLHNDLQGGINVDAAKKVSAGVVAANPDFVLSTGDLGESRYARDHAAAVESWNMLFDCLRDEFASFIFQPVSGNHDEPENPDSYWHRLFELPDAHDYALDVGPIRFIMVDSTENEAPSRTAWLARELQKAAYDPEATWVIPAFHRPPFSEGERWGDGSIRQWWVPLFTKYEANMVLSGHAHTYQRTKPIGGVPYLVSGGGGGWLYRVEPEHPSMEFATSAYHFVQFRVEGETMLLEGKLPDGTVFDRAEFRARRRVRVEPVFPVRGEACTIWYKAKEGPLAGRNDVWLHLGRDEFNELLVEMPMERDEIRGEWKATFVVPESPKWHLAFCFRNQDQTVWDNNHRQNWQAILARDW